ncbi:15864_t:CDS:1, partial [Cetraspora pellucida]
AEKKLEKDHNNTWLMRETKFVSKKKNDLIQIVTSHKEELELLDAE